MSRKQFLIQLSILNIVIEQLRLQLEALVEMHGNLQDPAIIKKSQELDAYITMYYDLSEKWAANSWAYHFG